MKSSGLDDRPGTRLDLISCGRHGSLRWNLPFPPNPAGNYADLERLVRTDGGHSGSREQAAGFDPEPTFMIDPASSQVDWARTFAPDFGTIRTKL